MCLLAAIQREFANGGAEFPTGDKFTRIAVYDLQQLDTPEEIDELCNGWRCGGDWDFYFYTMDSNDPDNWAGLSEIIPVGPAEYLVIERDGEIGAASQLKKIYAFTKGEAFDPHCPLLLTYWGLSIHWFFLQY